MQIVIIAGGMGTRLRSAVDGLPKSLAPINGKPFVEYQINLVRKAGISDIVLCVGYGADQIMSYLGTGHDLGVNIKYSVEDTPLGTAGALENANTLLGKEFFVTYGDSYLVLDYSDIAKRFVESETLGLMVVHRNEDKYDRSNVVVHGGKVVFYSKTERRPDMVFLDHGLTMLSKEAINLISDDRPCDLSQLFGRLIQNKQLAAYETQHRPYEIGSPKSLEEFREFIEQKEDL
ncbi:MAG: nucleotidyl transferase [SAR202 cluster bacterium]|nr:nucleotidyl transferase [SAR202 cluster bacterium]|tara:strand:+ start:2455 stop:3153 length:699 start_codon:yes stop_codon:yes gene_type:complete